MEKNAILETSVGSNSMRKAHPAINAYPSLGGTKHSSLQVCDCDLEKAKPGDENSVARQDDDLNVVDWDGPDDPEMPINWTATKKWTNIIIISALTMLTCVGPTLPGLL